MKFSILTSSGIALALVLFISSVAGAVDNCPQGQYWNGYKCAPNEQDGGYYGPPGVVLPGDREGYDRYAHRSQKNCYTIFGRQICCKANLTPQVGRRGLVRCCPHG